MARKRMRQLRGLAEPCLTRVPLPVRLCSAFVDNLALILRVGLVLGAVAFIHDFHSITDELESSAHRAAAPPTDVDDPRPPTQPAPREPVLTERVKHYLNCTFEDYRAAHYDACVEEPSDIYRKPEAGPDDTGRLDHDTPVLFANLDDGRGHEAGL
jgi:hypothetical protein